MNKGSKDQVSP